MDIRAVTAIRILPIGKGIEHPCQGAAHLGLGAPKPPATSTAWFGPGKHCVIARLNRDVTELQRRLDETREELSDLRMGRRS